MRILIIAILVFFSSCNVAKKVFRHKDKTVIEVKKDSSGRQDTHIDTSRKTTLKVIESTDIIKPGVNKKAKSQLDLDVLKLAAQKGQPLITVLLDSAGNMMGTVSNSLDTLTNKINQLTNLVAPPEEYHNKKVTNSDEEQKGLTDHHQESALKVDNKQQNETQEMTKDVKRSPAWIKIGLVIALAIIVLLAIFKRKNIWAWLKNKILNK